MSLPHATWSRSLVPLHYSTNVLWSQRATPIVESGLMNVNSFIRSLVHFEASDSKSRAAGLLLPHKPAKDGSSSSSTACFDRPTHYQSLCQVNQAHQAPNQPTNNLCLTTRTPRKRSHSCSHAYAAAYVPCGRRLRSSQTSSSRSRSRSQYRNRLPSRVRGVWAPP